MEPILNLPPREFRAALAELQLNPQREAELVRLYEEANAPQQGGRNRGMLRNLLDNIIGFDDEVVTPGERLGAGVQAFAGGLLSDPVGTAGNIVQGGYETIERAMAPGATPMDVMGAAGMAMGAGGLLARPAGSVGMGGRVAPDARASDWIDDLRSRYPNAQIDVSGGPGRGYTVSRIIVPEDARSQGIGTQIMREITDIADSQGATVALTPSSDFGGNVSRLRDFYGRMGFVANTGRNRDMSINEDMYREPISANRSTTTGLLASAASDTPAQRVARLLREGRADEVTDDLMAQADPQEMFRLYQAGETGMDLPMDEASRMARAREMGFDTDAYHETGADFSAFDIARRGAGAGDSEMPSGVFTKPHGGSIGLGGESQIQMPLLVNRGNNFSVLDRALMRMEATRLDPRYNEAWLRAQDYDETTSRAYDARFEGDAGQEFLKRDPDRYFADADAFLADWNARNVELGQAARSVLDDALRGAGYDSATVARDEGFLGRVTPTTVVFDPTRIRSRFARFDPRLSHLRNLNAANVDPITGAAAVTASQQDDPLANLRAYIAASGGVLPR